MNIYKKCIIGSLLGIGILFSSCKKTIEINDYKGINEIVADIPSGGYQIQEGGNKTVVINFSLTTVLPEDLKLDLSWDAADDNPIKPQEVFELSEKSVTITKGSLTASVIVKSAGAKNLITKNSQYKLKAISSHAAISGKFDDIIITIIPADDSPVLSLEQQRRLKESKVKIALWTGLIPVEVKVVSENGGSYGFEQGGIFTYSGKTTIVPNESAANISTLQMIKNAFGLNEYYYKVFRGETIDISGPDLTDPNQAGFNYDIIQLSNWTRTSIENFNMQLNDLVFVPESPGAKRGTVKIVKENISGGEKEYFVPITYDFSAAKRLNDMAENKENAEAIEFRGSLDPDGLLTTRPMSDEYTTGTGTYNEETGKLTFVIYLSHSFDSGIPEQISITYTSPQV